MQKNKKHLKKKASFFLTIYIATIVIIITLINGIAMYSLNFSTSATETTPTPTIIPTISITIVPTTSLLTGVNTPIPTQNTSPTQGQPSPTIQSMPTSQPSLTSAPTPTSIPSSTPMPTLVIQQGSTILNVAVFIHGIGKAGDGANPGSEGVSNPITPQRLVYIKVYNDSNELIASGNGTAEYDQAEGNFKGKVDIGKGIETGSYFIDFKVLYNVVKENQELVSIINGKENNIPSVKLFSGDINNDDQLSILDYNIMRDCYADNLPPIACTDNVKKMLADINNDGFVNQVDYNLFMRESANVANN